MKKSKFKNLLAFFTTILLVFMIVMTINGRSKMSAFENALNVVISPVQSVMNGISSVISDIAYPFKNMFVLSEENKILKAVNSDLQQEVIKLTLSREEYNELKKLQLALKYVKKINSDNYVTADVVYRDPSNWYTIFMINVGTKSGIDKNSMVITDDGLVGQVYEASENFSKVITLSDVKGSVSFKILDEKRNYDGIINANIEGGFSGYFFDINAQVSVGDKLVTSGLGIYPEGIMIGEVTKVLDDSDTILKNIELKSYVDFKKISKVLVVPPNRNINKIIKSDR